MAVSRLGRQKNIRALVRANRGALDVQELREYFRLFERESMLDEILKGPT